jgi:hypothetical protein
MADNFATDASGNVLSKNFASREVTYSGDTLRHIAPVGLVLFTGSDDAKTATDVSSTSPLPTETPGFATSDTPASVALSTTAATLLAANANRKRYRLLNTGAQPAKIRESASDATTSVYDFILQPGESYEDKSPCWTGKVSAILDTSTGSILKSEKTA